MLHVLEGYERRPAGPDREHAEGLHAGLAPAAIYPYTGGCGAVRTSARRGLAWRPLEVVERACRPEYDSCMKRITVSLPDELVEKIKRAAGGERQVSSYVATALKDYQERENLDDILAAWHAETPVPEDVRRQVENELDQVGLTGRPERGDRLAG